MAKQMETSEAYAKATKALNSMNGSQLILACIHEEIRGVPNDPEENPVCMYLEKQTGIEFTLTDAGIEAVNFLQMPETIHPPFWVSEFLQMFNSGKMPQLIKGATDATNRG